LVVLVLTASQQQQQQAHLAFHHPSKGLDSSKLEHTWFNTWIILRSELTSFKQLDNTHTQLQGLQAFLLDLETSKHLVQQLYLSMFNAFHVGEVVPP